MTYTPRGTARGTGTLRGTLRGVLRMTPGRRLLALERMAAAAAARPDADALAAPFADARARHHRALALETDWRSVRGDRAIHRPDARALDAAVDRAVRALHDVLDGIIRAFDAPEAALAREIRAAVFPDGAGPIVRLAYVEQHAAVRGIVDALDPATALGQAAQTLHLGRWIARIDEVNQAHGRALCRPARLTWAEVRAADDDAYEALCEMVARVLGLYPSPRPAHTAGRAAILAPLRVEQEAFTTLRAERRAAVARTRPEPEPEPEPEREPEPPDAAVPSMPSTPSVATAAGNEPREAPLSRLRASWTCRARKRPPTTGHLPGTTGARPESAARLVASTCCQRSERGADHRPDENRACDPPTRLTEPTRSAAASAVGARRRVGGGVVGRRHVVDLGVGGRVGHRRTASEPKNGCQGHP